MIKPDRSNEEVRASDTTKKPGKRILAAFIWIFKGETLHLFKVSKPVIPLLDIYFKELITCAQRFVFIITLFLKARKKGHNPTAGS